MTEKKRLDILLVERGLAASREKARALIMAGEVLVGDSPAEKAGTRVAADAPLRLRGNVKKYASRGGEKLAGALEDFSLDPAGLHVLDVGASTGGFTDCLLKRGAASVTALDVGYGQLDGALRNDPRVAVMDRTNARNVKPEEFTRKFDLITIDVSFISLLKVLPALAPLLKEDGRMAALVKPQYEAGRAAVGKGGVVKDPAAHEKSLVAVMGGAEEIGLYARAAAFSRLPGPKGNIEFFLLLAREPMGDRPDAAAVVRAAHEQLSNLFC